MNRISIMKNSSLEISPSLLNQWRNDTPGCSHRNHLNNAGAALMPQSVIEAIHNHINLEAEIGGYEAADAAEDLIAESYSHIANLISAKSRNIAMVENATVATSQALSAFSFQPGDVIVTTNVDYSSNQIMLLSLAERFGIKIVRADDLPNGGVDPNSVEQLLKKHHPKLVLMSWIPTNSGLIQDAKSVGELCKTHGVPFVLDACQAIGQFPVDVNEVPCDFLAATARKFLRGPRGIGFLYVSDAALDKDYRPLFPDTHGAAWTEPDRYELEPDATRFENWEFSYALLLGMGAAAKYANELNLKSAGKRAIELADMVRNKLRKFPGVAIQDRGDHLCAIVSVTVDGRNPDDLVQQLRKKKINTSAASRTAGVIDMRAKGADAILRISPHYYNTEEEIERLMEVLESLVAGSR